MSIIVRKRLWGAKEIQKEKRKNWTEVLADRPWSEPAITMRGTSAKLFWCCFSNNFGHPKCKQDQKDQAEKFQHLERGKEGEKWKNNVISLCPYEQTNKNKTKPSFPLPRKINSTKKKGKERKGKERKSTMSLPKTFQCTRTGTFHFLSVNHTHKRMTATKYNFRFWGSGRRRIDHCPQKCWIQAQQMCREFLEKQAYYRKRIERIQPCPSKIRFRSLRSCIEKGFLFSIFFLFFFSHFLLLTWFLLQPFLPKKKIQVMNQML